MPDPAPADGQVLVQIHAVGVNQLDSKIRSGEFDRLPPYRPGVRRFDVGDEVYARPDNARSARSQRSSR